MIAERADRIATPDNGSQLGLVRGRRQTDSAANGHVAGQSVVRTLNPFSET